MKRARSWILFAVAFAASLFAFVVRYGYYAPSTLVLEGSAPHPVEVTVRWDTGDGFNEREGTSRTLTAEATLDATRMHTVEIRRTGKRHPEARDAEVWLDLVTTTDASGTNRPVELSPEQVVGTAARSGSRLCLTSDGSVFRFEKAFSSLELSFVQHPHSGEAEILVDGRTAARVDLYSAEEKVTRPLRIGRVPVPGPFLAELPLPQLKVHSLRLVGDEVGAAVTAVKVRGPSGTLDLTPSLRSTPTSLEIPEVELGTRRLHPLLLSLQLLLAALCAGLVVWLSGLKERWGRTTWRETLRALFLEERRWVFWLMFLGSTAIFATWALAWWPGMMTADSLGSWQQLKLLEFSNWNPLAYTLYVLALVQFWDSPMAVVVVQLLATAALGSGIFFFLYREGLRLRWILPFFALFALSVPVAVYNLLVWRDVPFCLLTVAIAFSLYALMLRKAEGRKVDLTRGQVAVCAALLAFASLVRHNGLIYLVVVPVLLLIPRLLPRRTILSLGGGALALVVAFQFVVIPATGASERTPGALIKMSLQLNSWAWLYRDPLAWSPTPAEDRQKLERFLSMQDLQRDYNPLSVTSLVYSPRANDAITDAEASELTGLYVRRMLQNFHIFASERTYLFLAALGFRNWGYSSNLWGREMLHHHAEWQLLHDAPKWPAMRRLQERLVRPSDGYTGLWGGSFLMWNAFFPLLLVLGVFLLSRWLPMSAFACFFLLIQVAALYFTIISNDFRYVYFLHLFAYFLVPSVALEVKRGRAARAQAGSGPTAIPHLAEPPARAEPAAL